MSWYSAYSRWMLQQSFLNDFVPFYGSFVCLIPQIILDLHRSLPSILCSLFCIDSVCRRGATCILFIHTYQCCASHHLQKSKSKNFHLEIYQVHKVVLILCLMIQLVQEVKFLLTILEIIFWNLIAVSEREVCFAIFSKEIHFWKEFAFFIFVFRYLDRKLSSFIGKLFCRKIKFKPKNNVNLWIFHDQTWLQHWGSVRVDFDIIIHFDFRLCICYFFFHLHHIYYS